MCKKVLVYALILLQIAYCWKDQYTECGENEEYSTCMYPECEGCSLAIFNTTRKCEKGPCVAGCKCIKGYHRTALKECISLQQCQIDLCGPESTFSECGYNDCDSTCKEPYREEYCVLAREPDCVPGCICNEGFLPDKISKNDFTCTPISDCVCEDPHAIIKYCPSQCTGETCDDAVVKCPEEDNCPVLIGCECEPGYVKDQDGSCTPLSECAPRKDADKCHDPFKVYSRAPTVTGSCDSKFPVKASGCICRPGFWFTSKTDKTCIRKDACDPITCPGKNMEWSTCGNNLCQLTCENVAKPYHCVYECNPGCVCKKGYVLNKAGECIEPKHCENPVCEPNAEFSLCPSCKKSCYNVNASCVTVCDEPGCSCKDGLYYSHYQEKCVPIDKCTNEMICPENEIFVECNLDRECENTCKEPKLRKSCTPKEAKCVPDCVCQPGHVRDKTVGRGKCIPERECVCSDPNAWTVFCPNNCPGGTCDQPEFQPCNATCTLRGCECKPGFLKNWAGKCVKPENCKTCPPNEVYSEHAPDCPEVCPGSSSYSMCYTSRPGCVCAPGLVRATKAGKCIRRNRCPQPRRKYIYHV